MGFFSELLGTVAPIVATAFGGPAAGAAATGIAGLLTGGETVTKVGGTGLTAGAVQAFVQATPGITAAAVAAGACPTGTGGLRKRTIVQTICPTTGKVFKQEIFAGGVAIRASDVAAAKRVFRQVSKLAAKMPRKTIKESAVKQLTDRVVKNALERAGDDPSCPK